MTTTPTLIGLLGKKRSGKDSFASVLVEEFGFQRVAFADPLRDAALALDPFVGPTSLPGDLAPSYHRLSEVIDALGWEAAKDFAPEVRRILQALGTDAIRALDDGFWVRMAMQQVEYLRIHRPFGSEDVPARPVVVTDVRFPNEAEAIRRAGGVLIRVERPGFDGDGHVTETALDGWPEDYVVDNDADLEALQGHARFYGQASKVNEL
jgi:hypothetical protein